MMLVIEFVTINKSEFSDFDSVLDTGNKVQ